MIKNKGLRFEFGENEEETEDITEEEGEETEEESDF